MAHLRTLFLFHTGSYNSSGTLNDSVWREYPWDYVHTVLLYSPHPELTAHARSVGANVALSLGAPKDLENGTARQAIIQTAIHNCAGANGCNSLNLDVERSIANGSAASRLLTTFATELSVAAAARNWSVFFDAAARPGYEGRNYDYRGLNNAGVNYFFAMDYDLNDYDDPPPDNDGSLANSPAPVVERGLRGLLAAGVPPSKLIVGLPFYAYEYRGFLGKRPITSWQRGLHEISSELRDASWTHTFDNASQTPYLSRGSGLAKQQLWYDDPPSIATKIAAARALGLSLSGCWTADALDYSGDAPVAADAYWAALRIS